MSESTEPERFDIRERWTFARRPGWPSPGAGLPRSSLAPPSASPNKNSPIPPSSLTANWKTRQAPGTSSEPYLIPVLGDPKKLVQALDTLRSLKSFPSPKAVNTTTGPQLPKYVSDAFGSPERPWWKPGYLRSAYGAICCHKFKPKNQTDDIFLAQILGHKLLGPNACLSVGQSYKDFYIRKTYL
jgi:Telomere resolvase